MILLDVPQAVSASALRPNGSGALAEPLRAERRRRGALGALAMAVWGMFASEGGAPHAAIKSSLIVSALVRMTPGDPASQSSVLKFFLYA